MSAVATDMLMFYCSADIQKKIRVRQEKRSVDKMGRCIEIICTKSTKISFNVVIRMHFFLFLCGRIFGAPPPLPPVSFG